MSVLTGVSAFAWTPADGEGVVDTDHLQRLVARLAESDVASIGVLGSTGSYMYLERAQRARALQAAVEASGSKPVLAGIGAMRSSEVLEHVKAAEAAGADALLLAPVSYLPLTDADFAGLTRDVAGATDLPICLYNNPKTTHFTMSEALVAQLSQIPGVAAVKNPVAVGDAAGQVARLRAATPAGFVLGNSGDAQIAEALAAGTDAWYSVIAGTLPELGCAMWAARQDPAELARLDAAAAPMWTLFNAHGGIRVVPEMLNHMGLGPVASPLPLLPLEPSARDATIAALDALTTALA